jgi:FkbM family methyltransferase
LISNLSLRRFLFYTVRIFSHSVFYSLGRKRYLPITPFLFTNLLTFDRINKNFFKLKLRSFTDLLVYDQIFLHEDYRISTSHIIQVNKFYEFLTANGMKPLIVDLGSNNGFSSKYFAQTYRSASIVGIEPNKSNFNIAKINSSESNFFNYAVGSKSGKVTIKDENVSSWAFQTIESTVGNIDLITVNEIIKEFPDCKPFIIKIDIEGFERNLFDNNTSWIDEFPVLIIELHDWMLPYEGNSKNFLKSITSRDRDFIYSGENIFSISHQINM